MSRLFSPRRHSVLWLSWLALPIAVLLLARIEVAYSTPHQPIVLLPGIPWLSGTAQDSGRFWLSMVLGSLNTCWLAVWLSLLLLSGAHPSTDLGCGHGALRLRSARGWQAVAGPLAAFILSAAWAGNLAVRKGGDEVLGLWLFLHLPVQVISFGLLWLAQRGTGRTAIPIATFMAFAALHLAFQLRYQEPGTSAPPDVAVNYASMLLASSLAVFLWRHFGGSADRSAPSLPPRTQEVSNP